MSEQFYEKNILLGLVFGRLFAKRFALSYWTIVLSVCDVGVLCQMVGEIKMKLGMPVGLGPGHTDGWGSSSPSRKGA